jgi:predicted DNA-binding transcriptional regulator YafY
MTHRDHEVLAQRLTQILIKLNQGEQLIPSDLADEFGVTLRTIQRDLNERLSFLPLQKQDGKYSLPLSALGQLAQEDLRHFACLVGVQGLFPDLNHHFLQELFDVRTSSAWVVKGHAYENHQEHGLMFKQLESAIKQQHAVSFVYAKNQLTDGNNLPKTYDPVHPYQLVNHGGIWYLGAEHEHKIKAFALSKIERLLVIDTPFERKPELQQLLKNEDSIWLNTQKIKVVLSVTKEAAPYFERRKLVGGQEIEKHNADGSLIVSAQVAHPNQILPIVRYWIPHVRIVSPEGLRGEMEQGLQRYLDN